MRQLVLDFDGHDLISEPLGELIPLSMFLHECIEAFPVSGTVGEDQNIALGFFPLRLAYLVKRFDHTCIVASAGVP